MGYPCGQFANNRHLFLVHEPLFHLPPLRYVTIHQHRTQMLALGISYRRTGTLVHPSPCLEYPVGTGGVFHLLPKGLMTMGRITCREG